MFLPGVFCFVWFVLLELVALWRRAELADISQSVHPLATEPLGKKPICPTQTPTMMGNWEEAEQKVG